MMNQIIGTKTHRKYHSEEFGRSIITVEIIDFHSCLDSWEYDAPYVSDNTILPNKEQRQMPARWYGKDLMECSVRITEQNSNERYRHASLVRSVRPEKFNDTNGITWRTSCMIRNKRGIRIGRNDRENRTRTSDSLHDMFWELAGPDPITLKDNLEQLANEAHRLFEPRMQNRL